MDYFHSKVKNAIGKAYEYEQFRRMLEKYHRHYLTILFDKSFMQQAQEMGVQFASQLIVMRWGQIKAYEQDQFQSTANINVQSLLHQCTVIIRFIWT